VRRPALEQFLIPNEVIVMDLVEKLQLLVPPIYESSVELVSRSAARWGKKLFDRQFNWPREIASIARPPNNSFRASVGLVKYFVVIGSVEVANIEFLAIAVDCGVNGTGPQDHLGLGFVVELGHCSGPGVSSASRSSLVIVPVRTA
jgi:hypothetical protein